MRWSDVHGAYGCGQRPAILLLAISRRYRTSDYVASMVERISELETILNEAVVAKPRHYLGPRLETLEKKNQGNP